LETNTEKTVVTDDLNLPGVETEGESGAEVKRKIPSSADFDTAIQGELPPPNIDSKGKRRPRRINRAEQRARFEVRVQEHANDMLPKHDPTPGTNQKIKIKPVIGMDND
jgi:hypothetical protein